MPYWEDKFRAIMSVYLVLQRKNGDVLLLLRQNTGYKDGEYGLPAGHVDGGERLHTAMIREAQEEAGLVLKEEKLELIHTMHRLCKDGGEHERVDFFFVCREWEGEPVNTEPEKCAELSWHSLDKLPDNVIDYYAQMFDEWQQGRMVSYFGWE